MIKDSLKYDENKEEFYFQTEQGNVSITGHELFSVNQVIATAKIKQPLTSVRLSGGETLSITFREVKYPEAFCTIMINNERICSTDRAHDFQTFAANGTKDVYDRLNF